MLNIHNLTVSFHGESLFQKIAFQVSAGNRIGLVGKNGSGKSTLLRVISGDQSYDEGSIALGKDVKIGFLRQDIEFESGRTLVEETQQAFVELKDVEQKLEDINEQLNTRTDYESEAYHQILVDLHELQTRYEILGGYTYEGDTERILLGLGFKREAFDKLTEDFSGGWRMRIELAKLLLQRNDILLLDEPTNHLDIESIVWLERFLQTYEGAVILVSHDKMFLDNTTNRTIEISFGKIYDYKKPYSEYLVHRALLQEQQIAAQKNQQREIEQTEKLIERFRASATKASMAQSLIKKLDRMDRIEVEERDTTQLSLKFPLSIQPGRVVIKMEHLSKSFGEHKVLEDVNMLVPRGAKIAFVGQNGQGKSTLAKCIVGEESYEGVLGLGHNVQIGYFAQNQSEYLDGNLTVHETLIEASNDSNRKQVRSVLGAFLFRGDDVDKYVSVLSGGERNRLALAKLMMQSFNVLIMDEPTNHLDIDSKNVVKDALRNFEGTLILVSHDREFLQGLTDIVYEFADGEVKEFLGDIDYYLESRSATDFREVEKRTKTQPKETKKETVQEDEETRRERRILQNRFSKVERDIQTKESSLAKLDKELATKYEDGNVPEEFFKKYEKLKTELASLHKEWETLYLDLES
ncbi:MAG TPA: ABC-F family ATP-binding cassette domain-containing protein [Flavobacteriaceae bacterium]|nr:ABC-F family ATP-binding cassette domain-containing protein [Flavobacteriaceae bacterium]